MTIYNYFEARLELFNINLTDKFLRAFLTAKTLNETLEITKENKREADIIFLEIVLAVLMQPDIAEDNYSISYSRDFMIKWYGAECERLKVPNLLKQSEAKKVKNLSNLA